MSDLVSIQRAGVRPTVRSTGHAYRAIAPYLMRPGPASRHPLAITWRAGPAARHGMSASGGMQAREPRPAGRSESGRPGGKLTVPLQQFRDAHSRGEADRRPRCIRTVTRR
jgi:hypothetical protein